MEKKNNKVNNEKQTTAAIPQDDSVFKTLNNLDCSKFVEKREQLSYLSWASSWEMVMSIYPDASYEIVRYDGKPYLYDQVLGYMVETNVTIEGKTKSMWLPVMDNNNRAMKSEPYTYTVKNQNFKYAKWNDERKAYIDSYGKVQKEFVEKKVEAATMFDINTAIMRCLTKNIAMFGLGLYIYRGEDLPTVKAEEIDEQKAKENQEMQALQDAIQSLGKAKDMEELKAAFNSYPQYKDNKMFRAAVNKVAKKFE